MKKSVYLLLITILFTLVSCTSKDQITKILKENPEILTSAIEENPEQFIEALNNAVKKAQSAQAEKRQQAEQEELSKRYDDPLKPKIRKDETIRGTKGAPLVLVEYSDFECPFCRRAWGTIEALLKKYDGKIQFIYKHLPLSFHPNAEIAAKYYEAIRLQSEDKAFKFHDKLLADGKLSNGESYLKKLAKDLKVDMKKLEKDVKSEKVAKRIQEDMQEAAKFGIQGTPGFILNGIPIKGAYPLSHFEDIISELKKRGKVKI